MRAFPFLGTALCFALAAGPQARAQAPNQATQATKPNYEQAARWSGSKVAKLSFTAAVTPTWFDSGDRFYYAFETSKGRRWMLVNTVTKTKTPLFDAADMAARLTNLVRIPYDSAHLPIQNLKLAKKDTVLQFELFVPVETKIPGLVEKVDKEKKDTSTATQGGQTGQGGRGAAPTGAAHSAIFGFVRSCDSNNCWDVRACR